MRLLGIDYGKKYIGLAIADDSVNVATAFGELSTADALSRLSEIIHEEKVNQIIVGLPLSFKMEETAASAAARTFGQKLAKITNLRIEFENEILTTSQVEKETGKKSHSAAAVLILQSWLDKKYRK